MVFETHDRQAEPRPELDKTATSVILLRLLKPLRVLLVYRRKSGKRKKQKEIKEKSDVRPSRLGVAPFYCGEAPVTPRSSESEFPNHWEL